MSVELPEGWQNFELGQFCIQHSRRAGSVDLPIFSVSKDHGLISQAELFSRRIASDNTSNYKTLKRGEYAYDPMLLWTGSIGELKSVDEAMISPAYVTFSLDQRHVNKDYFNTLIKLPRMVKRYKSISTGTNVRRQKARFDDYSMIVVTLPPYPEQLAIAEVLRSVEDAIARKRELIGTLGETKKAVMRELLTKGTRRENAPLKPLPERWVLGRIAGGVKQIPKDWKLVRLTSVAKLESGHTPNREKPEYWGGTIPWLSLGDTDALDQLTIENTLEQVTEKGIKNSSARVLPVDTVIFSRTATVGKACRLAVEMATSQDFANWVCGSDLDPRYLVQVFRHMKREWDRLQAGSTHQTIYMPTFKRLQILLPPKAEQGKIADTGEAFDRRIEAEKQSLAELQNTRAALAQELLSGRLRLPSSMIARFENAPPSGKMSEAVTA